MAMKKYYAESELIINPDGSIFHLHVKPEQLADKIILVGDPGRVALVASHFDTIECEVESREFKTITGTYKDKRITVVSTGIGCDNIDIVMNELDALANIDFKSRYEKDKLRQLQLVRIGTCGGLQPYTPVGTYICSEKSIGFDGLLNFYAGRNEVCDLKMEQAFINYMGWEGRSQVWSKVKEEIGEFEAEVENMDKEKAEAEFGDVMFSLINAARLYKINPDNALEHTNQKFIRRFNYLEEHTIKQGKELKNMTLEEMDAIWNEAKSKGL